MKNKSIKLLIPMIFITIVTIIIMVYTTLIQYNKINMKTNICIAKILSKIQENYPNIRSEDIIKILNDDNVDIEIGEKELKKYGINLDGNNGVLSTDFQMKRNIQINIFIILSFSIIWIIAILIYINRRNKKLNGITQYIHQINNKNYELKIYDNDEDELSYLRNELYKITIMLKEEAEKSKLDKENLKISIQDISHQLKTPLTSIGVMLDNIRDNHNMDENVKQKFIYEINKQIDGMNFLVISLLKISKLEAGVEQFEKNKISVNKLIKEALSNLEIPIEIKNHNIIVNGKENVCFYGDYRWQLEAITNIIKNCIEHTQNNKNIFITYEENNLYTKIKIKDEGEGIAKEDLIHIFERFYKGKKSSNDSFGIGLALSKTIIEKDNGYITCNSVENDGTEFIIKYMK